MMDKKSKTYDDGVDWLMNHGFIAQYEGRSWSRRGVTMYYDEHGQEWTAGCGDYLGEYTPTPESALTALRVFLLREQKSLLKQAIIIGKSLERLVRC